MLGVSTLDDYLQLDIRDFRSRLQRESVESWSRLGEETALATFHEAARRVPAYGDFLTRHNVRADGITSYREFCDIPVTDKANYIDQYPLEDLVWDGRLGANYLIHTSSGTTGTAYLWPATTEEIAQAAAIYEIVCREHFGIDKASTLLVICFGMGTWIAGSYTLAAAQFFNQKGYEFTIMTPGFDMAETLKVLSLLGPKFQQAIVTGIPSFVKDLVQQLQTIDTARPQNMKFLLAGEGFTEPWRDHVLDGVGSDLPPTDVVSVLGSADAGLMGFETRASVACRRRAAGDSSLRQALFGTDRTPMLMNYIPPHRFFEQCDQELLVTANRGLPLIRYNIHDEGRVLPANCVAEAMGEPLDGSFGSLPYVAVLGRGTFATTFYGVMIHAEEVQNVLLHPSVADRVTGRFVLETAYTDDHDQQLRFHVELADHVANEPELAERLGNVFVETVRRASSEYNRFYSQYETRAAPVVVLENYGDPARFPRDRQKKTS